MHIEKLEKRPLTTCTPEDTLDRVARLLRERDLEAIAVVDSAGILVGLVTSSDVSVTALDWGLPLRELRVVQAMQPGPITCRVEAPIDLAEALMRERQLRRLPIVDANGRPVGILALAGLTERAAPAANAPARPERRPSDPDFTWMLAECSIPISVSEHLWGL